MYGDRKCGARHDWPVICKLPVVKLGDRELGACGDRPGINYSSMAKLAGGCVFGEGGAHPGEPHHLGS